MPAARGVWPPALAPTAEFTPTAMPAARPTATALTASAYNFPRRRISCITGPSPGFANKCNRTPGLSPLTPTPIANSRTQPLAGLRLPLRGGRRSAGGQFGDGLDGEVVQP